ncbi:hypothetical protein OG985_44560 [Streptomyces sp. NBC_00289]|uniref:hypothetical protein n=1 Tax=Streptomyces sp. NBC_00289 TaxID=2975703 RepID=UPI003255C436
MPQLGDEQVVLAFSSRQLRRGDGVYERAIQASARAATGGGEWVNCWRCPSITWYDATGHRAGTSTVRPTRRSVTSYNPGDALLAGTVTSGPLNETRIMESATPTSDVSGCIVKGLLTLSAAGTLKSQR